MKFYSLLLLIVAAGNSFAQIVLGPDRIMTEGDHVTMWQMDTTGVDEGHSGENAVWNFNGIASLDALVMDFVSASSTPFHSSFPAANIAGVVSEGAIASYTYFSVSGNEVYTHGTASGGFASVYSDIQTTASYPFSYNSFFSDTYQGATDLGEGMISTKSGDITSAADAYGTITLPDGSTASALRVRTIVTSTDSLFENGVFVGESVYDTDTYTWYINNAKYPVFSISYIYMEFLGQTFEIKNVQYTPQSTTGADDEDLQANSYYLEQNYPNPFNPSTTISFSVPERSEVSLKVYNLLGNEIASLVSGVKEQGNYKIDFNGEGLTSGIYFYSLNVGGKVETRKMTLVK